ncbi:MAG: stage II sporulation protein M [Methanomicrobia archaeon]|nr:stage II sporulation protein M [Methanomicrobia archaeon]
MEGKISLSAYLHSLRFYILFVSVLFVGSIVFGYMGFQSEIFSEPVEWIQELSENIKDSTQEYPSWLIFFAFFAVIFLNNAFACFLDIILGPLIGIFPMFSAFINGGLLGWFAQKEGLMVFLAIVPHGIFELPAFLFSVAIGLRLGREVLKRKSERHLKKELGDGLKVFVILILPLLLIAALIESVLIVATLFLF